MPTPITKVMNPVHPDAFRKITSEKEYLKERITIDPIKPRSILKLDENMAEAMKKMEKVNRIMQLLPMVDCGICGAPTCQALAQDIAQGEGSISAMYFHPENYGTKR